MRSRYAGAVVVAIAAIAGTTQAAAQYRGAAGQACTIGLGYSCRSAAAPERGLPAYQRWSDGTPALGAASPPPQTSSYPAYFNSFSSVHDFGR